MMKNLVIALGAVLVMSTGAVQAQGAPAPLVPAKVAMPGYKPTIDDWMGVNAAVNNYTLGLELHDSARFGKAFWPEGVVIVQPEPGLRFSMPYQQAEAGPPKPPPGAPMGAPPGAPAGAPPMPKGNAIGGENPPWHLALSHSFEFQSATRATHYGYFVSVYPDLKTKMTVVGLPGHYEDILEQRNGEWRILQRTTVIGAK
jgi:hypothetical protein